MTPEEAEIMAESLQRKEKRIQEQAFALQKAQAEMEQQQNLGSAIMDQIAQRLSVLDVFAEKLERINQQVQEIQEPARIDSREPLPPQGTPQNSLPRVRSVGDLRPEPSPIRFKDAVDAIPKFDGHRMSVFHFSKICERTLDLIPLYHEYHLVQMIINKLQGHAYSAVEGIEFHSVFELTRHLKRIFGPNKSADQYRGELANIFMKPNEAILDYIARVKELRGIILDFETDESGFIHDSVRERIDETCMTSFVNGLPSELLMRVKIERCATFDECIVAAIQISHQIRAESARGRPAKDNRIFRADYPQGFRSQQFNVYQEEPRPVSILKRDSNMPRPFIKPLVPGQPGPNFPTRVCFHCKDPGHFRNECPKLMMQGRPPANSRPILGAQNPENFRSVPNPDARRNEIPQGRPTSAGPSTARVNAVMVPENLENNEELLTN